MSRNWHQGNADEDGRNQRGWILGHFIDPAEGVRSNDDVEIKWGIHHTGENRSGWTAHDQQTTVSILVSGKFRIDLTETSVTLDVRVTTSPGDRAAAILGKPLPIRRSSPSDGLPRRRIAAWPNPGRNVMTNSGRGP